MKRKLSMILALSATLIMLAACSNTNENSQAELVTDSTSVAVAENEVKQEIPASEETYKEKTPDTYVAYTESTSTDPVKYANIEMPNPFKNEGGDLNADFY